jgi:hypothetical protein
MRKLLGGKGTINLLDCSAENAPNTDLYLYLLLRSLGGPVFCLDRLASRWVVLWKGALACYLIVNVFTNRMTDGNNCCLLFIRDSEGLNYKTRTTFSDQSVQAVVNKGPQN